MAQFQPGHVHIERTALNTADHSYDLNIEYAVVREVNKHGIDFHMHGSIEGKPVEEKFYLSKEEVLPSFLSVATRKADSYMPSGKKFEQLGSIHKIYDLMFEDIRQKLEVKSGDSVNPEHFE